VTIVSLATTISALGTNEVVIRRIAQHPDSSRAELGLVLTIRTVVAVLAAVLLALVGPHFISGMVEPRLWLVALLPLIGAPAQSALYAWFLGRERHLSYAWFMAANFILYTVASLIVLLAGGDVVQSTATCGVLSIIVTAVTWRLCKFSPIMPRINRALIHEILERVRAGLPFVTWSVTLAAYGSIDRVLLGMNVPSSEVGWYAAAYRIISIPVFIPNLITAPLFPALSRSHDDPETLRRTIAQTLRLVLLLNIALSAIIIVGAPALPSLLHWPADFSNAVPLITILSLHLPAVAVDMVLGAVIMAVHREARWISVGLIATVFNATCNTLGIPFFEHAFGNGAISASIVTVLTEVLMFVGAVLVIPKNLLDTALVWEGARLVVSGTAAVLAGAAVLPVLVQTIPVLALAMIGAGALAAITYVAAAVLLRALTFNDMQAVVRLIASRRRGLAQAAS
jgi:O-antigen/teichoic acid export membrane protein